MPSKNSDSCISPEPWSSPIVIFCLSSVELKQMYYKHVPPCAHLVYNPPDDLMFVWPILLDLAHCIFLHGLEQWWLDLYRGLPFLYTTLDLLLPSYFPTDLLTHLGFLFLAFFSNLCAVWTDGMPIYEMGEWSGEDIATFLSRWSGGGWMCSTFSRSFPKQCER